MIKNTGMEDTGMDDTGMANTGMANMGMLHIPFRDIVYPASSIGEPTCYPWPMALGGWIAERRLLYGAAVDLPAWLGDDAMLAGFVVDIEQDADSVCYRLVALFRHDADFRTFQYRYPEFAASEGLGVASGGMSMGQPL